MRRRSFTQAVLLTAVVPVVFPCLAADMAAVAPVDAKTYQQTVDRAIEFLKSKQAQDGSFAAFAGPGVTAVATTGLLRVGVGPDDPLVAKSLKYLEDLRPARRRRLFAEEPVCKTTKPRWPWFASTRPIATTATTSY